MTTGVQTLFGVPIFSFYLDGGLTNLELQTIKNFERKQNQNNQSTVCANVLDTRELGRVKDFCSSCFSVAFLEYMKPPPGVEIYMTQSWANFTNKDQSHHMHTHANSFLSGVLYVQTDDNDKIIFENPLINNNAVKVIPTEWNEWNSDMWWVPAEVNKFVVFPSSLAHGVDHKFHSGERISVAANTFLKGFIGSDNTKTGLYL